MTKLQPNLAPPSLSVTDLAGLVYPLFSSEKLDGVRATLEDGVLYSRKGIALPEACQERFAPLLAKVDHKHIIDCEIYSHEATFQEITSAIHGTKDIPIQLHVIDHVFKDEWYGKSHTIFADRLTNLGNFVSEYDPQRKFIQPVRQTICLTEKDVMDCLDGVLGAAEHYGYTAEGLMLRGLRQLYKHGRSTLKQKDFLKLKLWDTIDGIITGFKPKSVLTEEAKSTITDTDAYGHAKRGHRIGDREYVDEIGSIEITANIGARRVCFYAVFAKNSPDREKITWANRESYFGKWCEIEFLPAGMKEEGLPRHPRIIRLRPDK